MAALCSAPAMLFLNSVLGRDDLQTRALPLGRVLFFPLVFFFPSSLPSFALRKHLFPDVVLESNKRSKRP